MSAGASPHTPLAELTVLPRPPSWFQGGRFTVGGEWRGGKRRTRGGGQGEGRGKGGVGNGGGTGKGRETGDVWGIAPWFLGIDTPA